MTDDGEKVQLYVYDLSNGLARQLSPMLLNKQACACLHTVEVSADCEIKQVLLADRWYLAH